MRERGERQSIELLVLQCPPSTAGEAKCRDRTRRSFCLSVTSWGSRWAYGPTLQLLQQLYTYTYNMYLFLSQKLGYSMEYRCIPLPPPMPRRFTSGDKKNTCKDLGRPMCSSSAPFHWSSEKLHSSSNCPSKGKGRDPTHKDGPSQLRFPCGRAKRLIMANARQCLGWLY